MSVLGVEAEGPAPQRNLAAVPLDGSHTVSPVVAGSDAEVPLAEHGVAVTRNDEVARCPQTLGQDVYEPAGDDHLTIIANCAGEVYRSQTSSRARRSATRDVHPPTGPVAYYRRLDSCDH
jgi:hypothetical protein